MKNIIRVFTAVGLFSASAAMADEKMETTKTHETDGKKTTMTKKVKHKSDGNGNSEVKTEIDRKTETSNPSGKGGEKTEVTRTHDTEGKKTTSKTKVTHKSGAKGDEVKTETVNKTEIK